jgi:copper chaperone CopZ
MTTTVWAVQGMTCGHCVAAVTEEISAIPGVSEVAVELASGLVTVVAEAEPSAESIASAVDEAGYSLLLA